MDEGRFYPTAGRSAPGWPRVAAVAVSATGHATLLGLLLLVSLPQRPLPREPEHDVRFFRFPRPPQPLLKPPVPPVQVVPAGAPPVMAQPEAAKQEAAKVEPQKAARAEAQPARARKATGRAPKSRARDLDQTPLPPEGHLLRADEAGPASAREAAREAALRGAAEAARASTAAAITANAGAAQAGFTPQEERSAFAAALAEAFHAHWVLPPGSPREAALVALTVRLLGASYRLDCAPASGLGGETGPRACAAIAAAALPDLPPSLRRDGLTLKFRFVP